MNIYIYGTFEKESQWRGASLPSGRNHTEYIYLYIYINQGYHPRRKIRRRIEWDGVTPRFESGDSNAGSARFRMKTTRPDHHR